MSDVRDSQIYQDIKSTCDNIFRKTNSTQYLEIIALANLSDVPNIPKMTVWRFKYPHAVQLIMNQLVTDFGIDYTYGHGDKYICVYNSFIPDSNQ